jgi:hypothetical protein
MIVSPSVVTELGVDLMEVAGVDGAQAAVFAQRHGPCLESVSFMALKTAQPSRQHA